MKQFGWIILGSILSITTVNAAPENGKRPDFSNVCIGKTLNTKMSIKHDGRNIPGICQLGFKPNYPASLERGAMRDPALRNICNGKTKGTTVIAKVNGKNISGKCDLTFKSDMQR